MSDWPEVEAAAKVAGWVRIGSAWVGVCPVTKLGHTSVEYGSRARDGVLMRCSNPTCISPRPDNPAVKLGKERYERHKAALLELGRWP